MPWRDNIRKGSFRGVEFDTQETLSESGRNNVVHLFPFNDFPLVEDLGKDTSIFTIEAFVIRNIGNNFDYFPQRDALEEALTTSGIGKLVHPFRGNKNVAVLGRPVIRESFLEGGIARFTITFVEAEKAELIVQDNKGIGDLESVDTAAGNAVLASKEDFATNLSEKVTDFSEITDEGSIFETALDFVNDVVEIVNTGIAYARMVQNGVNNIKNGVSNVINAAVDYAKNLETIIDDIITFPKDLANTVTQGIDSFTGVMGLYEDDLDFITGGLGFSNKDDPETTSTEQATISAVQTSITRKKDILINSFDVVNNNQNEILNNTNLIDGGSITEREANIKGGSVIAGNVAIDVNNKPLTKRSKELTGSLINLLIEMNKFGESSDSSETSGLGGAVNIVEKTTLKNTVIANNQRSIINLVRNASLAAASRIAIRNSYKSSNEALETMRKIIEALSFQIEKLKAEITDATDASFSIVVNHDNSIAGLEDLRTVFFKSMQNVGASLANVVNFETPPDVLSTLTLAYDKYEDLARSEDIEDRNVSIKHPGFIPNKNTIEVLSA